MADEKTSTADPEKGGTPPPPVKVNRLYHVLLLGFVLGLVARFALEGSPLPDLLRPYACAYQAFCNEHISNGYVRFWAKLPAESNWWGTMVQNLMFFIVDHTLAKLTGARRRRSSSTWAWKRAQTGGVEGSDTADDLSSTRTAESKVAAEKNPSEIQSE